MPTSLTRRVTFAAAHRYRVPTWTDAQNSAAFGPCARPNYHGHSYICDVTITAAPDPVSGFVIDLGKLDRVLNIEVRDRFDHMNINLDVEEFADGALLPSGENLARFIGQRVQASLGSDATVTRVTVAEDLTLSATWEPD